MSEKMQILTMVQNGKITAEEGARLLDALENNIEFEGQSNNKKAKWLKIKVFDPEDGAKVNIKLPISLISIGANVGIKLATKFSPEFKEVGFTDNDMNEILDIIKSGEVGKIIEVDTEKGEKVEIVIE